MNAWSLAFPRGVPEQRRLDLAGAMAKVRKELAETPEQRIPDLGTIARRYHWHARMPWEWTEEVEGLGHAVALQDVPQALERYHQAITPEPLRGF